MDTINNLDLTIGEIFEVIQALNIDSNTDKDLISAYIKLSKKLNDDIKKNKSKNLDQ
jgi:hypothetical protein|tara:strand:+ start:738 stop:908 length:171 start_codon:yes stop_codon:yes gene_type:complete